MNIIDALLAAVAPHDCMGCGAEGTLLCRPCRMERFSPLPSKCYRCRALTSEYAVCGPCRPKTPLKHVWMATEYKGFAKDVVHRLKFERAGAAAVPLAEAIADILPFFEKSLLVVPVPTASSRVRQRGYDQAVLLAKQIARKKRLRYSSVLRRSGQARQVGATRSERLRQLEGAFYVPAPQKVTGAEVLLVDDIATTGASLEAAARTLKQAGAQKVYGAVFAHKL